jgi:hypothetical protein
MPGGCTLSAHRAGKLIAKTDGQTETEKDTYAKLYVMHCAWHYCIPWKDTHHDAKDRTRMDVQLGKSLFS